MQVNYKRLSLFLVFTCLLLSSSLTYVVLSQGTNIPTITSGPYAGAPSYTVYMEGSTCYAKNAYGNIDYEGTNARQIINNALASLTVGRVQQETVLLKGAFNLYDSTILLPSYVFFDLNNAVIYVEDANAIQAEGTNSTNLKHVSIVGGHIICSDMGIWAGIFFHYVENFLISNVEVEHAGHGGIFLMDVQYGIVQNCNPHNNGYDGIGILQGDSTTVDVLIQGNTCTENGQDGIFVDDDSTSLYGGIRILDNYVISNGNITMGPRLDNILLGKNNNGAIISRNHALDGYADGIALTECNNCTISDNVVSFNGNGGFGSGITLAGCSNCTLNSNVVNKNDEYGIWVAYSTTPIQSTNNMISGCSAINNNIEDLRFQVGSTKNVVVCSTFDLIKDYGSNNKINLCWNATTWIG